MSLSSFRLFYLLSVFSVATYGHGPVPTTGSDSTQHPTVTADGGLCDDLYRFTCAPGVYDDGTGKASSGKDFNERVGEYRREFQSKLEKVFLENLKKPGHSYMRELALSAFGLENSPQCVDPKKVSACNATIAQALSGVSIRRVLPDSFPRFVLTADPMLRDMDLLTSNRQFLAIEKAFAEKVSNEIEDPKLVKKTKDVLIPRVKALITSLIEKSVSDAKVKQKLIKKVNGVSFRGGSCSENDKEEGSPSLSPSLQSNAMYYPASNSISVCMGYYINRQSDFSLVHTIAHELMHSIDPCSITYAPKTIAFKYSDPMSVVKSDGEFPFNGLIECLRSKESLRAWSRWRDKEVHEASMREISSKWHELKAPGPAREVTCEMGEEVGCGSDEKTPPRTSYSLHCHDDQIQEAFADWGATEVLPQYMEKFHSDLSKQQMRIGYSNTFRGVCSSTRGYHGSYGQIHPQTRLRVNNMILVNPKVRQQMGCPKEIASGAKHCKTEAQKKEAP